MEILDIQILKGPNVWSLNHKVIVIKLDIGKFEEIPTDKIDGFYDRIRQILPGLYEHYCSEGKSGGFYERIKRGTWIGHVTEHVALELQIMAGMNTSFGQTRGTGRRGIYNVAFAFEEARAGIYAGHAAVRIAEALGKGYNYNIGPDIENLKRIVAEDSLGPSTSAIVEAAVARDIPVTRMDNGSLVQLGYGSMLKRIEATINDCTSCIAIDLAGDKYRTKFLLETASIPVPEGYRIKEVSELELAIASIGFPLVVKPQDGNQGKGVSLNIRNHETALAAYKKAGKYSDHIMVERYFAGKDYRLLVVNYKLTAAALRTPAKVTGDGVSAIWELVHKVNLDPARGEDHEKVLTKIRIDDSTIELLNHQDLTLGSVPPVGKEVILKQTANLSTGGTSENVTDSLHPEVVAMAERVARLIGLDICGIDVISEDITLPLKNGNTVVIEVNAAPGLRMHTHPYKGKPCHVGDAVVRMMFPGNSKGRIPIVAITGTNGKTTTARLIAHIAGTAGYKVGLTTTDGIYINDQLIEEGDCTGPASAETILRDRLVDFAVLECARGGILRSGLAFDQCSTGIVTNVAEDHLGLRDINTPKEMAKVKSLIPETVKRGGMAVLNENNEFTYNMKYNVKCPVALFSINPYSERLLAHCKNGGIAAVYLDRRVLLMKGETIILTEDIENIPCAFDGKAAFMIENILAAILSSYAENIDNEHIIKALRSFMPTPETIPGRMNLIMFRNFRFLLDYAHNFHGISALGSFLRQDAASYKVGIISSAGDRRDIDILKVGEASAAIFDKIIIRVDEDTRGRKDSEIIELLYAGITNVNKNIPVEIIKSELEAIKHTIKTHVPDSLIVLFSEKIRKSIDLIMELKDMEKELTYETVSYGHVNRY